MIQKDEKKTTNEKPVSITPLDFQEALKSLLHVKSESQEKKPRKKEGKQIV